jgi:hypothetical protein
MREDADLQQGTPPKKRVRLAISIRDIPRGSKVIEDAVVV